MQNLSTCLWFDTQAEEAAAFYVGVFPDSAILDITRYPEGSPRPGSVLTVRFSLNGIEFTALNGGPHFTFTPAMSLVAHCDTQEEVDALWAKLLEGGRESQCGWLTDKYGVSWQIIPRALLALLDTADRAASQRAFQAVTTMVKLDLAAVRRAYDRL